MPTLPLPTGDVGINSGDLPVVDEDSIRLLEPHLVQDGDPAPVRNAIRAALVALYTNYQNVTDFAARQSDVRYATGIYLDGLGRDEGVFRQTDEPYTQLGDSAYRARIIVQGGTVAPEVIMAAVNSILAPYTTIRAAYLEELMDCGFCRSDLVNTNVAFVRDPPEVAGGATQGNADPTYLSRLLPDDAASNLGVSLANRHPGGFFCFSDDNGRLFVIRIPSLSGVDAQGAFAFDGTPVLGVTPESKGYGIFCTNGSVVPADTTWSFFRNAPAVAAAIYQSIVNAVNRLVGHSIRWTLIPDPLLI
jgi:hypothetical protein